jgi:hypothetical protein
MPLNPRTPTTPFTADIIGRYVCNTLDEAKLSASTAVDPDARPFDRIVIGGGTFGSILAGLLFIRDRTHAHRTLVLDAGQMVFTEHVQNQPTLTTEEVWGVPWDSDSSMSWNRQFPGLAYCLGGRSLFWGGWSPYFIDSELPSPPWPATVKHDLTQPVLQLGGQNLSYQDDAARQLGTDITNDFVDGPLHQELRQQLFTGLSALPPGTQPTLTGQHGALAGAQDLEAPLSVQSTPPRPGFFPLNKFSATQMLVRMSRLAWTEADHSVPGSGDEQQSLNLKNVKKRLMVVPNTHVIRLERDPSSQRITKVVTNQGDVDVLQDGEVFVALGTIESTRLALATLPNGNGLAGRNLMAHLRSNLTIRVPASTYPVLTDELQVSALFVKGIHTHPDGSLGHFHIQITATGAGQFTTDSEAELFKKIPDLDTLDHFRDLTDQWIIVTLRGIGEIVGDRSATDPAAGTKPSRIELDGTQGPFDYGQRRARVRLEARDKDLALWDVMDAASDDLAAMFANGGPIQYLSGGTWQTAPPSANARRDKLSSTHHEGGTLWMGDNAANSVTDAWGKFHEAGNLYAVGPALLPTLGSPNPMLSGVALVHRLVDHLQPVPATPWLESNFTALFDGTERSFHNWKLAGRGAFALIEGAIVAQPGPDLGLLYYAARTFNNFTLRLQFRLPLPTGTGNDNAGVFVRFRDPRLPVPDPANPGTSNKYDNQAWVPVHTGFEVQIDEEGRPTGLDKHRTGAIYDVPTGAGGDPQLQTYTGHSPLAANTWHDLEIKVQGDTYTVRLNGQPATKFTKPNTAEYQHRGLSPAVDPASGFIGIQAHTGRVAFRRIRIKPSSCGAGPRATAAPRQAAFALWSGRWIERRRMARSALPEATLSYFVGWREERRGNLAAGGRLTIVYDPGRLPNCRGVRLGVPSWDIRGYVRFHPGGQHVEGRLVTRRDGKPVEPAQPVPLTVSVPVDARQVELWFTNSDARFCIAWDSHFGQNYWYEVAPRGP